MTAKEAIEIINPELSATEEGYEKAVNAGCDHSEDYESWLVACRMAFEALCVYDEYVELKDLNTPTPPIFVNHANRVPLEQFVPHCPHCDANCEPFISNGYTHCPYCGQAIALDN